MTSASPGRVHGQDSPRRQNWAGKSPQQVLAMYPPGRTPVNRVVAVLIELFNPLHTALEKTVSHKTRYERAHFLRRFFRELHTDAGFKLAPDPRNLGQRHVQAMVKVWQRRKLSPGTIQTYLSFLRGLAMWLNKPGFIRRPEHYGVSVPRTTPLRVSARCADVSATRPRRQASNSPRRHRRAAASCAAAAAPGRVA